MEEKRRNPTNGPGKVAPATSFISPARKCGVGDQPWNRVPQGRHESHATPLKNVPAAPQTAPESATVAPPGPHSVLHVPESTYLREAQKPRAIPLPVPD